MKNYKLLWNVIDKIKFDNNSNTEEIKCLLINSLNISQVIQLEKELYSLFEDLYKCLDLKEIAIFVKKDFNNEFDYLEEIEEIDFFIFNVIASGYENTLRCKKDLTSFLKEKDKTFIYNIFNYAIPNESEYNEYSSTYLIKYLSEKVDTTLALIEIVNKSDHLSENYKKEVSEKTMFFVDFAKKVLNKENFVFKKDFFNEKKKELDELSYWARDLISYKKQKETKNRVDRNDNKSFLVGYDYINIIEIIQINKKIENKILNFEEFG